MRLHSILTSFLLLAPLLAFAAEVVLEESQSDEHTPSDDHSQLDEFEIAAVFPDTNPFGHIVNGEKNDINVIVQSNIDKNVTIVGVAGSVHHPESEALIKNLTALKFNLPLVKGVKIQLPYSFYSEFKPGDIRLHVWVDRLVDGETERVHGFDSIITVVEPEASILDLKLISTYLIVAGIFGSLVYFAYSSFVPQPKKTRTKPTPTTITPSATTSGYQEEWIPEHHLRSKTKKSGALSGTSGDELSGTEMSGTEGKKTKRKSRK